MRGTIVHLTLHDLAVAVKNKSIFLILFIPFFVFSTLKLVDRSASEPTKTSIGLIRNETYPPPLLHALSVAASVVTVTHVTSETSGRGLLRDQKLDGLLLQGGGATNTLVLIVLRKESLRALAVVETVSALQKATEGRGNWISEVRAVHDEGIQQQSIPTWILMVVLLVSFIILPAQVAEEKEKNMLLALLQTPMGEMEWLSAKILSGMIMILVALLILHLLGNSFPDELVSYLAVIALGSFCFCSIGVLLGLLCRTQASARTLGVLMYLPHLLPVALADYSPQMMTIAPFLPSYQLFEPVKAIFLHERVVAQLFPELSCLAAVGLMAVASSYLLITKRWLLS